MVNENEEKIMTPEEFAERMQDIQDLLNDSDRPHDCEDSHRAMDRLMCELLESLGYREGVAIFENSPKWYA